MVDSTTDVLGLTKQTVGGNRNTWGTILNSVMDVIEDAIVGRTAVSTTGGSTTLTQAQYRRQFIDVSGTLTSDATIVVPNKSKKWIVTNSCSGDFAVLVKTSAGSATSVPAGTTKEIFCNALDGVFRTDRNDVGQVAFFGNAAVPDGWWECDGTAKSRAGRGIDLYNKVGTTWGAGNGATTFNIPDGKTAGKFLRSRTASVALATSQTDQNKAHTHGVTGISVASGGSHTHTGTTASNGAHSHTIIITDPGHVHGPDSNVTYVNVASGSESPRLAPSSGGTTFQTESATTGITASSNSTGAHTHTITTDSGGTHTHTLSGATDSDGGTEARPTNLSMLMCIKY